MTKQIIHTSINMYIKITIYKTSIKRNETNITIDKITINKHSK